MIEVKKRTLKQELFEVIAKHRNYWYDDIERFETNEALIDGENPNSEDVKATIHTHQEIYYKDVLVETLKEVLKEIDEVVK